MSVKVFYTRGKNSDNSELKSLTYPKQIPYSSETKLFEIKCGGCVDLIIKKGDLI